MSIYHIFTQTNYFPKPLALLRPPLSSLLAIQTSVQLFHAGYIFPLAYATSLDSSSCYLRLQAPCFWPGNRYGFRAKLIVTFSEVSSWSVPCDCAGCVTCILNPVTNLSDHILPSILSSGSATDFDYAVYLCKTQARGAGLEPTERAEYDRLQRIQRRRWHLVTAAANQADVCILLHMPLFKSPCWSGISIPSCLHVCTTASVDRDPPV